jgi:hypothetical protein
VSKNYKTVKIKNYDTCKEQTMAYKYYEEDYTTDVMYQADYDHAQDHLEGLIKAIYTTGSIEDIEWHLEEVLSVFEMKIPESKPIISKKSTIKEKSTERALQAWVGYTRAYADMLTNHPAKL